MLKWLKAWLERRRELQKERQAQREWEQEEQELAYRLLSIYKNLRVLVEELSPADKKNIAMLVVDEKYYSLMKLFDKYRATWLHQVFHKKVKPELEPVYRGGVMILQMIESAVVDEFRKEKEAEYEAANNNKVLNSVGW